jgi:hypothetical protein
MLVVRTKLGQSKIEGIGLFADQFIPKGTVTWKFDPRFDIYFESGEVEKMSELQKDLIIHFAYLSKKSGKYVYSHLPHQLPDNQWSFLPLFGYPLWQQYKFLRHLQIISHLRQYLAWLNDS